MTTTESDLPYLATAAVSVLVIALVTWVVAPTVLAEIAERAGLVGPGGYLGLFFFATGLVAGLFKTIHQIWLARRRLSKLDVEY